MVEITNDWITSTWKIKVRRMTKNLRPRSQTWKKRNIMTLSLLGFTWYMIFTEFSPYRRAIMIQQIQALRYERNLKIQLGDNPVIPGYNVHSLELKNNVSAPKLDMDMASDTNYEVGSVRAKNSPVILIWKAMEFQMDLYKTYFEYGMSEECGGCQVTTDRSHVATCAALVHFNAPSLHYEMDVPDPKLRHPNQTYVFWSRETPSKTYIFHNSLKDRRFDSIFNLTMNFRIDSDIIDYFGNPEYELRFFWKWRNNSNWFKPLLRKKTGLAIWIVSNCGSTYGATERMKYAKSLMNAGLNMTTYGTCFGKFLSDIRLECQRHKFYMSLENSAHCPDYVSEKFWRNGLRAHTVPVVWGPTKEDVAKIAPPKSYIHSEDFKTAKDLVDYLHYLDKNDTAYQEYHQWRNNPINKSILEEDIEPNYKSSMCRLCKRITKTPLKYKSIPSVHDWLYDTRYVDNLCFK